tara:strand:+ start:519 stop:1292 length:774 start_codon:yes stop_codon:yes gene_type:complete
MQNRIKKEYLVLIIDDHPQKVTFNAIKNNNRVEVLLSEKELWWVGSVNLGIKFLFDKYNLQDEDIVVFANNDVQIDEGCFDILEQEMQKNKNQIVHPRTFDQDEVEVSSGAKILTFFPYITRHPKDFKKDKEIIDMGTARFLMMSGSVLNKVGYINQDLVQYGGDNDFTLSAKRFHDIDTYIIRDAICRLDDTQTGIKNHNIPSLKELYRSFFSIKSPNNIKYRYIFFKNFFGKIGAFFITGSLSLNTVVKFMIRKI